MRLCWSRQNLWFVYIYIHTYIHILGSLGTALFWEPQSSHICSYFWAQCWLAESQIIRGRCSIVRPSSRRWERSSSVSADQMCDRDSKGAMYSHKMKLLWKEGILYTYIYIYTYICTVALSLSLLINVYNGWFNDDIRSPSSKYIYIYNIYITYNKYIYSIYTDIQILELTKENAGIMWIDKRSTGDI